MEHWPATFVCSHCGATFASRRQLRAHLSAHGISAPSVVPLPARPAVRIVPIPPELSAHRAPRLAAAAEDSAVPPIDKSHGRRRRNVKLLLAATLASLLAIVLLSSSASAFFFSSSTSVGFTLHVGTWQTHYLSFASDHSQAVHYSCGGCPTYSPIASADGQGNLVALDFGDVLVGSDTTWTQVFKIISSAPSALQVTFSASSFSGSASGTIAPSITRVGLPSHKSPATLEKGQTRNVVVELVVPVGTSPGTYAGTLTVAVVGGSESHIIPMTVCVLADKPCPPGPVTPAVTTTPSTSPSPTTSPTVSPSPDPSPSVTTTATPSPTPTATETASPSPAASDSPSPSPTPSPSVTATDTPTPAPTEAPLVTFTPGLATALPLAGSGTPAPVVASLQSDGTISLAFGSLTGASTFPFSDVLDLASLANSDASVSFSLSAGLGNGIAVGFWDAQQAALSSALTLPALATKQLAFVFNLPADTPLGEQQGTLTITVAFADGVTQQTVLPVSFTVVAAPAASPAPDPSPSPPATTAPAASPSPLPTPSDSVSPSASPSSSASGTSDSAPIS